MTLNRLAPALVTVVLVSAAFSVPFKQARAAVASGCCGKMDLNHDGTSEIEFVRRVERTGQYPFEAAGGSKGTVLVLMEDRLLQPLMGSRSLDEPLQTYVNDLAREGYNAFVLDVKLEPGLKQRQGGLDTLALRRVLQRIYRKDPDLKGVVLIGRFPYAFIVRQQYWERDDDIVLNQGKKNEKKFSGKHWLRNVPEYVALTADVVLGDMDGNWEKLYQMKPTALPYFNGVYPGKDVTIPTKDWEIGTITFSDYFFVQDGDCAIKDLPDGAKQFSPPRNLDQECTAADLKFPNPMARPELLVSHLDASGVALNPDPTLKNRDGVGIVDKFGWPQTVTFEKGKVPGNARCWQYDPFLERKLLWEYFARNHAYRTGIIADGKRPGSYSWEWDSSMPEFKRDVPGWKDLDTTGLDYLGTKITINDWIKWMERPAALRAIKAHANPWVHEYGGSRNPVELKKLIGERAWGWERRGDTLAPATFANGVGRFEFYRTLYENHVLPNAANMFVHIGCEGTIPGGWDTLPYGSPDWGKMQAEMSLIFYCNGLALIGRGKGFNDEPVEVGKVVGSGAPFGEVWRHYFDYDANDKGLNGDNGIRIARKQPYFWSVLGDWTVTLYPEGAAAK